MVTLYAETSTDALLTLESTESATLSAESSIFIDRTPAYTGSYEWTPTQSIQTIEIANQKATSNITINPIPSNYGLITWNGSTLTVS